MARSKAIIDIANGNVQVETSLKRLLVLLNCFNKPELLKWVDSELTGYNDYNELPEYRKMQGVIIGNYYIGNQYNHLDFNGHIVPTDGAPRQLVEQCKAIVITHSVSAVQSMLQSDNPPNKPIPARFYQKLVEGTNATLLNAHTAIDMLAIRNIIATVEKRTLDIFILLEKEFGILDELDIDLENKKPEETMAIVEQIITIIYTDKSITIGDGNKIRHTEIKTD